MKVKVLVSQSCPTLCDSMDCSPRGSPFHGTLQARILEWGAVPFFGGSSWPRDRTWGSHTVGRFFTIWATNFSVYFWAKCCKHWDLGFMVLTAYSDSLGVGGRRRGVQKAPQRTLTGTHCCSHSLGVYRGMNVLSESHFFLIFKMWSVLSTQTTQIYCQDETKSWTESISAKLFTNESFLALSFPFPQKLKFSTKLWKTTFSHFSQGNFTINLILYV